MKKINIKLLAGTHAVYKELRRYPPNNTNFSLDSSTISKKTTDEKHYKSGSNLKRKLGTGFFNFLNVPRMIYLPNEKNDIIHSCRGLLILNKKPLVLDFEHVASCANSNFHNLNKKSQQKIIQKMFASKYCKKLLPWTEPAKKSIFNYLNTRKFRDKIEVVYPAIHSIKFKKKKHNGINIFFLGMSFLPKGGLDLVEAFKLLEKKYDINLFMLTNLPEKYNYLKKNKKIHFFDAMPQKEIYKIYEKTDIFCLPSYVDSFGFAILEAKAFGIPVIAGNYLGMADTVKDNKNGLLVNFPPRLENYPFNKHPKREVPWYHKHNDVGKHKVIINEIKKKLKILINSTHLRKKFGLAGKKEVDSGRFSINYRNKQLSRIYEEANS